jgi:dTDP-4-dehydrorhamnose reductase
MKILVTGVSGLLGYDVAAELSGKTHTGFYPDRRQMDITDRKAVAGVFAEIKPDAVIHCAAWSAVDAAEDSPEACRLVNVTGTGNIAEACAAYGSKMLYISTDYVFSGEGTSPWRPDSDPREPLNVYGQSKLDGELIIERQLEKYFIVRTSCLFGRNGGGFAKAMLKLGKTHSRLQVVCDQYANPTYSADLARFLVDIADSDQYGCYHAVNAGECSRYEFVLEVFRQAFDMGYGAYDPERLLVEPVPDAFFPAKAKRPLNRRLSTDKLTASGFMALPPWQDALNRYLRGLDIGLL